MPRRELVDDEKRDEIGKRLTYIRENLNLTRRDIAESIFVSPQAIGNVERGCSISKSMCHHLWLVYSNYFYDCKDTERFLNSLDIQNDLDRVETYLYGEEE